MFMYWTWLLGKLWRECEWSRNVRYTIFYEILEENHIKFNKLIRLCENLKVRLKVRFIEIEIVCMIFSIFFKNEPSVWKILSCDCLTWMSRMWIDNSSIFLREVCSFHHWKGQMREWQWNHWKRFCQSRHWKPTKTSVKEIFIFIFKCPMKTWW